MGIDFQLNASLVDEFADANGYTETIIDPVTKENVPNPLSREMFAETTIKEFVKDKIIRFRKDRVLNDAIVDDIVL